MKRKIVFLLTFMILFGLFIVQEKAYASSSRITKVEAGITHNIALKDDGTVWTWGDNFYGQLGDGSKIQRNNPVQVRGLSNIIAIDAGGYHSVAVRNDGTVWSWGRNNKGQLGNGSLSDTQIPVQVTALDGIIDISCGEDFTIAVKNDGTLWGWGNNEYGQIGALQSWRAERVQIPSIGDVISVKVGRYHAVALKRNGELWTWGYNGFGQLGDNTQVNKSSPIYIINGVSAIGAGYFNTYAIKKDGTVWGWGHNSFGQLGVDTCEYAQYSPVQMLGATNVKYIAGGYFHTIVIKSDGTVWSCGSDRWGELGDGIVYNGTNNEKTTLVQMAGISGATTVTGGENYTVVLLQDGSVWGCGKNNKSQLGE